MTDYMLAMWNRSNDLAVPRGVLVAAEEPGHVFIVAAVGHRPSDPDGLADAVRSAIESVPDRPDDMSVAEWFRDMAGHRTGDISIVGPFTWDAEPREIEHWAMDRAGLRAREIPTPMMNRGRAVSFTD